MRRRRECLACGSRFTTYESFDEEPLTVRKRSGVVEPYERSKLKRSVQIACAKRPVSESIDRIVDEIEEQLAGTGEREVASDQIGELVMAILSGIDQVAYVRFASVYRNFQETTEFEQEVRDLARRRRYEAPGQADLFGEAAVSSDERTGEKG